MTYELADAMAAPLLSKPGANVNPDRSQVTDATSQLTRAIAGGDEAAFARFYDLYSGRIYGLLLVLTHGRGETARDLHQMVMIKVARKLRVFQSEAELWAWLAQVARNAFRDHVRKQARRLKTSALDLNPVTDTQNAEPLFEWLDEGLQNLDEEERLLIEAFYFENQGQREIAEANGQSLKAVESKLARTRAKLRAFITRKTRHEQ